MYFDHAFDAGRLGINIGVPPFSFRVDQYFA
jgi:hypothetical protein